MSIAAKNVRVRMTCGNLKDVPEFAIPAGFSLRWYKPGDESAWFGIQKQADRYNPITPEWFEGEFGFDREPLRQRQCYVLNDQGEATGTGTAWFDDDFEGARVGRIHWIAVVPEYQRRGLGKAIMTQLCQRLNEFGHTRSYLITSTGRIPAIKLYLRFGFQPLIRSVEDEAAWQEVEERLQIKALAA